MIDPAILRPGRLDVKIKIERPDAQAAADILAKYLTPNLPLTRRPRPSTAAIRGDGRGDDRAHGGADVLRGRREPVPGGHLRQRRQGGPVLQGLQLRRHDREHRASRAKKNAIKDFLETGAEGHPPAAPARCDVSTSSGRTRTCRTPPTPTTGRRSRARRASGSSTSAPWFRASRATSRAAPSTTWPTRVSTSTASHPRE
jgi:proteasome-associated ATPase